MTVVLIMIIEGIFYRTLTSENATSTVIAAHIGALHALRSPSSGFERLSQNPDLKLIDRLYIALLRLSSEIWIQPRVYQDVIRNYMTEDGTSGISSK